MDVAHRLAARVGEALNRQGLVLTAAESCTGGWVAQMITSVPGSSAWFDRGFVTYSNASKQELLGVSADTIARQGAVSEAVVCEMAEGALRASGAQLAVAISGIAGPEGGSRDKPVGTVCLGWAREGRPTICRTTHYAGDRHMVREQAMMASLHGILDLLEQVD